jgi:hypothetical protein
MGLRGAAVNGNFDGERPPFRKIVSYSRVDKGSVGEEGKEQPFLFGIRVDVEEIRSGKDFTPRVKEPETTCVRDFVQDTAVFFVSELALLGFSVTCIQVVIAMGTLQVAASGQFDRAAERSSKGSDMLVKLQTPIFVSLDFHGLLPIESHPQTGAFAVLMSFCTMQKDAGSWMLDTG